MKNKIITLLLTLSMLLCLSACSTFTSGEEKNSVQATDVTTSESEKATSFFETTTVFETTSQTQVPVTSSNTSQSSQLPNQSTSNNNTKNVYRLYYIVSNDILGIIGFDDGISLFDVSSAKAELEPHGYTIEFIELDGKNDIIIPTSIDGYSVYAIDGGAFCNCTSIKSITIPSCVQIIEPGAFRGCNNSLIIYGEINSEAQAYAEENNITFYQK